MIVSVRMMVVTAWCLTLLTSSPQAVIFRVIKDDKKDFYQCTTLNFFESWATEVGVLVHQTLHCTAFSAAAPGRQRDCPPAGWADSLPVGGPLPHLLQLPSLLWSGHSSGRQLHKDLLPIEEQHRRFHKKECGGDQQQQQEENVDCTQNVNSPLCSFCPLLDPIHRHGYLVKHYWMAIFRYLMYLTNLIFRDTIDITSAREVPLIVQDILYCTAVLNSCINPFVYGLYYHSEKANQQRVTSNIVTRDCDNIRITTTTV